MTEARYYSVRDGLAVCALCPHGCEIADGRAGRCLARRNTGGKLFAVSYGRITSLALDPIEKKPLRYFKPGSQILSAGSFGCNMRCFFCQNHEILRYEAQSRSIAPDELAMLSRAQPGNIGVAFTYNEPLCGFEYVLDAAKRIKQQGQAVVLVTNGMINPAPLAELLPFVDAMNIDLKVFDAEAYRRLGGELAATLRTIETASGACHVEITTLVVPGMSDDEDMLRREFEWIAALDSGIPLHLSRYFPRYKADMPPTGAKELMRLADLARACLRHVYTGNL